MRTSRRCRGIVPTVHHVNADDQDGDPLSEFFFKAGDARKLARALELVADRLDNFGV
jgi:hypothetical protein